MSRRNIPPSFVHHEVDGEEVLVGEFHYGSASDLKVLASGKGIKLFLTDPPYNLGFDYGEVSDNLPEEEYHQMMEDTLDSCFDAADDDAHMFLIHYPQHLAKMWPHITKKWKFHQWITWAYPANFGHSSKKWTNASRAILWLVKGDPEFYGDRVVQPYRNPTDRRIKKLIHEEGKIGTHLYNWWNVNLCKNVSKDKKDYSNQIPEVLLERIILCTTNLGDIVADPFSGTFSTSRTAMRLGRRAWGCDLNPDVVQWRPTVDEYVHEPEIPEQQYDQEYPFYELQEAGMTEGQFEKIAVHLFRNVSASELAKAPGIGIKKSREFIQTLSATRRPNTPSIYDFNNPEHEVEEIPTPHKSSIERFSIPKGQIDGKASGGRTISTDSFTLRKEMRVECEKWDTAQDVMDMKNDSEKIWTSCGPPILGGRLWGGKPGKDGVKNGRTDIRFRVFDEEVDPNEDPSNPITPMYTFADFIELFHQVLSNLDEAEKEEFWSLLLSMKRPTIGVNYQCNKKYDNHWYPHNRILELNNKVGDIDGFQLIHICLAWEGCLRSEDNLYLIYESEAGEGEGKVVKNHSKTRGRGETSSSVLGALHARANIPGDIDPDYQFLWDSYTARLSEHVTLKTADALMRAGK